MKPTYARADIFKALGHPVRVRIVESLRDDGESCVCHLEHRLGLRQAYLSQHLAKMRAAGVVTDRRVGSNVFYVLVGDWVPKLLETVGAPESSPAAGRSAGGRARTRRACPCPRCADKPIRSSGTQTTRPGRSIAA